MVTRWKIVSFGIGIADAIWGDEFYKWIDKIKKRRMIFDYLYYKLYQATLKGSLKDIPQYITPVYLGGAIGINLLVIYLFLVKVNFLPYFFSNVKQGGWVALFFIIIAMIFYSKSRREAILGKYSQESKTERKRGNAVVWVYVIVSFLLIFAVGLFKPGYLGK